MEVSLIIPVYNVEGYLDKCLQSVEKQTCKDIEVIIINDGSTDNSYEIVKKYVERNENFQCYTIENRGQGGARNYGLEKARGKYVCFLDSDDYISVDCIEKLLQKAKESDSDVVVCNNYDVDEDGNVIEYYKNKYQHSTTSVHEEPSIFFNRVCPWGKLYKKELFEGLEFVSRQWYEDMRLLPKVLLKANKVSYIEDSLFYYVQRQGSTMNNSKVERNIEIINAFEDLFSYFKQNGFYEQFKEELEYLVIEHIVVAGITRVALQKGTKRRGVLQKMQEYLSDFSELYNNSYICSMDENKRLILFLNKNKLYWVSALCIRMKKLIR